MNSIQHSSSKWKFRSITSEDQSFMWELLYIALWDAPEESRRPRAVLEHPQIRQLVSDWGRPEDFGLLLIDPENQLPAGGIWTRLDGCDGMPGYGCDYPALGIAVLEGYQGRGLGQILMQQFIDALRPHCAGLRLGVHPRNQAAIRLYEKFGFRQYAQGARDYLQMKLEFTGRCIS